MKSIYVLFFVICASTTTYALSNNLRCDSPDYFYSVYVNLQNKTIKQVGMRTGRTILSDRVNIIGSLQNKLVISSASKGEVYLTLGTGKNGIAGGGLVDNDYVTCQFE